MTVRWFVASLSVAVMSLGLSGCGFMKPAAPEAVGPDPLTAGNAAYERKDYATACRELLRAGSAAGPEALTRAGTACARDGLSKADQAYAAALTANAKYAPAMEGLGMAALAGGDVTRARDLLEHAAKAGGKDATAFVALGDAWLLSGQCSKALDAYQEAARRNAGLAAAKSRLQAVRLVCGAPHKAAPAAVQTESRAPRTGGPELSPAAPSNGAGSKGADKPKAAPRTIDLNDI